MNYRLKDALGKELDCSYTLHKLKPVAIDSSLPELSEEVELIIDHKIIDGNGKIYLMLKIPGSLKITFIR